MLNLNCSNVTVSWSSLWEVTVSTLFTLLIWIKAFIRLTFQWRGDFYLRCFKFQMKCKKSKTASFVKTSDPRSHILTLSWFSCALGLPDQPRGVHPPRKVQSSDYFGDEDVKALRSRSAARPGEISPLVTRCSSWGRAPLTLGWFWKCARALSWIRLHIQTFCWALRRPCSSPLANMASRYDSNLAQTSGMPSLVCEEARTTWRGSRGEGCGMQVWIIKCLFPNKQVGAWITILRTSHKAKQTAHQP